MSTTIDNRVLEMRFDNKQFESGVATSMSTLDKLKQKLNLSGAAKGLESINTAAKKTDFSGMVSGIDTVNTRFSYLQMSIQHQLNQIVDSCVNAGKRMASALTIDPIKMGFQEYETQINAVQTILANTSSKGTTLDQVNQALDELNMYADKTIYNFTEMTRNIGTFTAAGVDLETSVSAIQGIANVAAVSGSTSQQASTAMYQLSQALATGTVKLMDWNSVVNAGMGGEVFQNALKETSELLGTGAEASIKAAGSFRESLKDGWLTSEVLTETLKKFTTSGANEYVAKYTGLSVEAVQASLKSAKAQYGEADAIEYASKALAEKSGKNEEEIASVLNMARTAEDAATKVKTFTQLWDTLKEAMQSGWTQTWEIIIGDFEESKELFTGISDTIGEFINKSSEVRNSVLEGAMTSNWDKLVQKINEAGIETGTFESKIEEVAKSHNVNVDSLIKKYGSLEDAIQAGAISTDILKEAVKGLGGSVLDLKGLFRFGDGLDEASEDVKNVQKALEDAGYSLEQFGVDGKFGQETLAAVKAFQEAHDLVADGIVGPETLKALEEASGTTGELTDEVFGLIDGVTELGGRQLLIESFKNAFEGLKQVFGSIKGAWETIFPPSSIEERSEKLYGMLEAFHSFSERLIPTEETAAKLQRTFQGLFAILDIMRTVVGGGLGAAFKILSKVMGAFDVDILSVTAGIGDAIVAFRDWLIEGNLVAKTIDALVDQLPILVDKFKAWFSVFKETPAVQKLVDAINSIKDAFTKLTSGEISVEDFASNLGTGLANALKSLPGIAIQIGKDFIAGFQNGISDSVGGIIDKIVSFCLNFVSAFAEALGVQSPSWKAYDIVVDFFQGAINGIKAMIDKVLDALGPVGEGIIKVFTSLWDFITDESGNIQWGNIFAGGIVVSMIVVIKKIADAVGGLVDILGGFGNLCDEAASAIKRVGKAIALDFKAKAIQKMATSLLMMVAAVWVISKIDLPDLAKAVVTIGILAGILVGLAVAMDKMSQASVKIGKGGANIDGLKSGLLQIGIAMLLLAATVKMIGDMDVDQAKQGFAGLAGLAVGLIAFMAVIGEISRYSKDMSSFGKTMTKMAVAMLLMTYVIKIVSSMDPGDIIVGIAVMEAFVLLFAQMGIANRLAGGNATKFGGTLMKMSIAMMLMAGVIKIVSSMDPGDVLVGVAVMEAFVLLFAQMGIANRIAGGNATKFGGTVLAMSLSMVLLSGVIKILSGMDVGDVLKGIVIMEAFVLLIAEMLLIAKLGKNTGKLAGTILSMSVAIGILAGVAVLLSMIDLGGLAKGITAVGLLSIIMTGMIKALKGAQNVKGSILMMSIAIGAMAAAVIALSFIEPGKLAGATAALSMLMGMFALMTKASGGAKVSIGNIAVMLVAVGILAAILAALSILDVGSTIEIAASIGILMTTLGVTMQLINKAGDNAMQAIVPMAILTVMAGLIGLMLVGLSKLNPGPTLEVAVALSAVLVAMSGAALILSKIGPAASAGLTGAAGFLALVVAAGAILGVIGGLVALIPGAEEFLNSGVPIMSAIGQNLGALIGGLIGGIGEGMTNSLPEIGQNIAYFMDKLATASANASGIEPGSFDGVGGLISALIGMNIAELVNKFASGILGESSMESFKTNALDFVDTISEISTKLESTTINETAIGSITSAGKMFTELNNSLPRTGGIAQDLAGEQDLVKFGAACAAFADCMLAINTSVSGEGFAVNSEAISALVTAGERFNELNMALPKTGGIAQDLAGEEDLAGFGKSCKAFANAMIEVNTSVSGEGFAVNSEAISALAAAGEAFNELNTALPKTGGIAQDLAGEQDLAKFGAACTAFAACIIAVNTALNSGEITIDVASIEQMSAAGEALNNLQGKLPKSGGWWQDIAGEQDIADFGEKIKTFAGAMGKIKTAMGEDGISENVVTSITNTGNALTALIQSLPEEGFFDGKMNLNEFSDYISNFGTALSDFGTDIGEIDSTAISTAITAAYQIKYLIEAISGIDASGIASFTGIGTGGVGADGLVSDIGKAISGFSKEVAGIDVEAIDTSVSAALKLKSLISGLAGLDTSGIENFKIASIGTSMKIYSEKVAGMDTAVVSTSISAANRLKTFISGLTGLDSSGIANFKPGSIGSSLKSYSESVAGINIEAISTSISAANRIKSFISGLAGLDTSGVASFKSAMSSFGKTNISNFTKAFSSQTKNLSSVGTDMMSSITKGLTSGKSSLTSAVSSTVGSAVDEINKKKNSFRSVGESIMTNLINGINSQKSKVSTTVTSSVSSAASSIRNYYSSFYSAGSYLGDGLIIGINSRQSSVWNAAYALGRAAVEGEKAGQASNSPSKLTIQAGKWLGEGLVIGIEKMGTKVYNAGHDLGDSAANSMSRSISKVSELIDGGMDTQPTIRPVLDLSDVQSGVGAIDGMFGHGFTIGATANVGAISTAMNRRIQNGGNTEVVSAINRLRKDLGNIQPSVTNINGVTYDDGSNISDAVQTLVRAARVERRR